MIEQDREQFTQLMIMMSEVSAGTEELKRPSKNKIKMYFDFLKDLDFELIKENANLHFRKNKWFPAISELRNESDEQIEKEAIQAFEKIKQLMSKYYWGEFGNSCRNIMIMKLKESNQDNLVPYLDEWGIEIANGNTQVVRSQFIKTYKSLEGSSDRLLNKHSKETKQIGAILKELKL